MVFLSLVEEYRDRSRDSLSENKAVFVLFMRNRWRLSFAILIVLLYVLSRKFNNSVKDLVSAPFVLRYVYFRGIFDLLPTEQPPTLKSHQKDLSNKFVFVFSFFEKLLNYDDDTTMSSVQSMVV